MKTSYILAIIVGVIAVSLLAYSSITGFAVAQPDSSLPQPDEGFMLTKSCNNKWYDIVGKLTELEASGIDDDEVFASDSNEAKEIRQLVKEYVLKCTKKGHCQYAGKDYLKMMGLPESSTSYDLCSAMKMKCLFTKQIDYYFYYDSEDGRCSGKTQFEGRDTSMLGCNLNMNHIAREECVQYATSLYGEPYGGDVRYGTNTPEEHIAANFN
ncbi:hypothetical protein HYW76_04340 [Candidatus Pacearchaeota archaeon]|nr:hypothetical protein [Candidatus Pacearchaeota archaeon]